ncbi:hypothetical protein, partial [Escherichia coli]|uniref:hypothetical protein n=1 Tax=Escherichia coli TaxID=562 RepID=UPI002879723B
GLKADTEVLNTLNSCRLFLGLRWVQARAIVPGGKKQNPGCWNSPGLYFGKIRNAYQTWR